jgi:hypothetical protein
MFLARCDNHPQYLIISNRCQEPKGNNTGAVIVGSFVGCPVHDIEDMNERCPESSSRPHFYGPLAPALPSQTSLISSRASDRPHRTTLPATPHILFQRRACECSLL